MYYTTIRFKLIWTFGRNTNGQYLKNIDDFFYVFTLYSLLESELL